MPEKDRAERLGEAGQRQSADQRQAADDNHRGNRGVEAPDDPVLERTQVDQELADEPVQGRYAADGDRADQKGRGRPGHASDKSAQQVEVARPAAVQDCAGAQKQQSLEDGMIDHMKQPARKAEDRQRRRMDVHAQQAQAQAHRDDADVLDAVIGQQPLEVMLRQREQHAQDAGHHADCDQYPAPPGLGWP